MVEIQGELDPTGRASADNVIAGLQAAFKSKGTQGVILKINSPGGSPVQAGEINDEIRRLRGKYPDTPIYAVVEEICASGAYYVAVAADRIYVDKASLVGSIGVIMDGFGFVGAMDKLGIERRAITAGENKAFLDPFSPMSPEQKDYAQQMLEEIHQPVHRRGQGGSRQSRSRIRRSSSRAWYGTAREASSSASTDALGSVRSVARDVVKADDIVDFTVQENVAERVARKFGAAVGRSLAATAGGPSGCARLPRLCVQVPRRESFDPLRQPFAPRRCLTPALSVPLRVPSPRRRHRYRGPRTILFSFRGSRAQGHATGASSLFAGPCPRC